MESRQDHDAAPSQDCPVAAMNAAWMAAHKTATFLSFVTLLILA